MRETLSRLLDVLSGSRIAIFIGRNDTGKSTLIRQIAACMDVSIIDSDIGQSDIGPPTVVSLGERHDGSYRVVDGYFCGSTTPARHFLQLIAGTSRMAKRVKHYPALVNTTGLATGEIGRALKTEKINALDPDVIIGMGHGLEYLDAFARAGATVIHLPVSPEVRRKTVAERQELRQRSFGEHFRNASIVSFQFDDFSVERSLLFNGRQREFEDGSLLADISDGEAIAVTSDKSWDVKAFMKARDVKTMHVYSPEDLANVLVGLVDGTGKFCGLGIITAFDLENKEVGLLTPTSSFSVLQIGSIKLDPEDFSHIGPFSGHAYRA